MGAHPQLFFVFFSHPFGVDHDPKVVNRVRRLSEVGLLKERPKWLNWLGSQGYDKRNDVLHIFVKCQNEHGG
jgi:hypothetical protein